MNLDDLRKIAEREKARYRWVTLSPERVIELLDRVAEAERALQRVREVIEREKHWNDECGWDVPLIALTCALEGDE